jgi:2-polyprenyl-6-methoxyphenol hydroxylase-like FAD-dependent oxidoreductase
MPSGHTRVPASWSTVTLSRQQQAASFGIEGATVHRADLLQVLADALPVGIVILGKRCTEVRPDGDLAVARFADGSQIEADIIVGADGIHSSVRTSLFGPDTPRFTGKVCYRSIVPAEVIRGARSSASFGQWLGPHGTIVLYPLPTIASNKPEAGGWIYRNGAS